MLLELESAQRHSDKHQRAATGLQYKVDEQRQENNARADLRVLYCTEVRTRTGAQTETQVAQVARVIIRLHP